MGLVRSGCFLLVCILTPACSTGWKVVRQAEPNPFRRGTTFAIDPLDWSAARLEVPASTERSVQDAVNARFTSQCSKRANGVRLRAEGADWYVRPRVTRTYPTVFAASTGQGAVAAIPIVVLDLRVEITDAAGNVLDVVVVSGTAQLKGISSSPPRWPPRT
jgi:hypothetical protein